MSSERRRLRAELLGAESAPAAMPDHLTRFVLAEWFDPTETPGPGDTAPANGPQDDPREALSAWRGARAFGRHLRARAEHRQAPTFAPRGRSTDTRR